MAITRFRKIGGNLYQIVPLGSATDCANAELCFRLASAAEENDESEYALDLYHRAILLDASIFEAWTNIGTIWFNRGDYVRAEECYRNALNINPEHAMSCCNLARTLEEMAGRTKEAEVFYLRAIEIDSLFRDAHYNLAFLYDRTRRYKEALEHWRSYLRCSGDDLESVVQIARDGIRRALAKSPLQVVAGRDILIEVNSR
jgi:tetratricopeptide (TPR) repeat protein